MLLPLHYLILLNLSSRYKAPPKVRQRRCPKLGHPRLILHGADLSYSSRYITLGLVKLIRF